MPFPAAVACPAGLLGGCRVEVRINGGLEALDPGLIELDVEDKDGNLGVLPVKAGLLALCPKNGDPHADACDVALLVGYIDLSDPLWLFLRVCSSWRS